jgi:hypothetical protein
MDDLPLFIDDALSSNDQSHEFTSFVLAFSTNKSLFFLKMQERSMFTQNITLIFLGRGGVKNPLG